MKVSIRLSPERQASDQERIANFHPDFEVSGPQDFGRIIQAAAEHFTTIEPGSRFWSDWLCVELSGPEQPHLTLVDLPGIIHRERGETANPGDIDRIKRLVRKYINDPRTIVLAVVDAQKDEDTQEIWDLVDTSESARQRTLGVITKPDRLERGSDLEKNAIRLAKNERLNLGLGWHVLRNLPHETSDRSPNSREQIERSFFSCGAWSSLPREDVGIVELREKLKRHLFGCVAADLPNLIAEMRRKRDQCETTIARLGPGRSTIDEQRAYLFKILQNLQRLVETALDGDYHKPEYASFFDRHDKRLRDKIRNDANAFASRMRDYGQQYHVFEHSVGSSLRSSYVIRISFHELHC